MEMQTLLSDVATGRPAHEPIHPAAQALSVSRQTLHSILAERAAVTPEMAVRLGKLCGNGPRLWLRTRQARDLWRAERDLAEVVASIPTMRGFVPSHHPLAT